MNDEEIKYTIALYLTKGIGLQRSKKLITSFGSAKKVFEARRFDLIRVAGLGNSSLKDFPSTKALEIAENELEFIKKNDIHFIRFDSDEYPFLLKQLYDCPLYLSIKGNFSLNSNRCISIVGTRNMTNYGKDFCENLVEQLAPYNPTIVSGLAYGVDITAHKSAIKYKLQNFAVVAHGLSQIYPKTHYNYAKQIREKGAIISEFLSSEIPNREHFPQRNRIIAGISKTTIVIEAAKKGGALITAELANDYNRDVFALPGRVGDINSEGCNNLIRHNQAILLNSPSDIIKYLGWDESKNVKSFQKSLFIETTKEEDDILKELTIKETTVDELSIKLNIPVFKIVPILLDLELKELIKPLTGKRFKLI